MMPWAVTAQVNRTNGSQSMKYTFPKNFKWCVATSAHQIEGYNRHSDWWLWESQGKVANKEHTQVAADHWNRVESDVELISKLNANTYRFSIEWAKIEPQEGVWDQGAINHYVQEIKLLKKKGIEPFITLHHFTLPNWVAEKGGWEWPDIPTAFERYSEKVFISLTKEAQIQNWITINEPTVFLAAGYIAGTFPPGRKSDLSALKTPLVNILKAHGKSFHILKKLAQVKNENIQVSMAHSMRVFDPKHSWNPLDQIISYYIDKIFNWAVLSAPITGELVMKVPFVVSIDEKLPEIKGTYDFIGFNYYNHDLVSFSFTFPFHKFEPTPGAPVNDLDWEIYPKGIYRIITEIHKRFPQFSIYITENGLADATDRQRKDYVEDHLIWVHKAISEGAPVQSYCHWSLMDNFEWEKGYGPRFGLYEVNYETQQRILRPSGHWFSAVAGQNGFNSDKDLR